MQIEAESAETIQAAAGIYRLLSRLWLNEIDQAFAAELNSDPLRSAFLNAGGDLPPTDAAGVETLAHDYCQLFIGPRDHLPPVQSVWREGTFQGSPADSMQDYLDILKQDPADSIVDHLGIELQTMSVILDSLATEENQDNRQTLNRMATVFFREHLAWCRQLVEQVEAKANTDFYKSVARLTADFLAGESEFWQAT